MKVRNQILFSYYKLIDKIYLFPLLLIALVNEHLIQFVCIMCLIETIRVTVGDLKLFKTLLIRELKEMSPIHIIVYLATYLYY